jgi:hypothetical protein
MIDRQIDSKKVCFMADPRPTLSSLDPHLLLRRVVWGGETLRRRLDVADAAVDFSILRDLQALGATDYVALPVASGHGARNYMITCDRPPGRLYRIGGRGRDARIATTANLD